MAHNIEVDILTNKISQLNNIPYIVKDKIPYQTESQIDDIDKVIDGLKSDWLIDVAGYFKNTKKNSYYSILDNEYKIQDLLYCQLRAILKDIQYEDPNSKTQGALSSTRIDFVSKRIKTFIEIKHASSKHRAKKIESEISEDIIKYGKTGKFKHLIFFIYCHNYSFPNKAQFEKGFTGIQTVFYNTFNIHCIIKP